VAGGALDEPVRRFVTELTPPLARLNPKIGEGDVAVEAYDIAASFVGADDRHGDDELAELIVAFAPWLPHLVGATPADVRRDGLVAGRRPWKYSPSTMFEVLLANDVRSGTHCARRYYELAMALAHTVCSLDAHPDTEELADLDRYRSVLLDALREYDAQRPAPSPPAGDGARDGAPAESLDDLLDELDGLVGLAGVKEEVRLTVNLLQVERLRRGRGLPVVETGRHLVFTGNPGTGKTTVARLLARLYRTLEVVDRGHLVETDRSGLVAGYVGQTAIQVRKVFEAALGGVLLVDEAYALAGGGEQDFGREAVATLVKLMEDHREDVVVIAAGYPEEMEVFVESNPGLRSRFPKTIHFADYSDDELVAIFESMGAANRYVCTPGAREMVRAWFARQPRRRGFGNARLARNLFEAAVARQASRIVALEHPTDEEIVSLLPADIP
jgi:hypothetical protein